MYAGVDVGGTKTLVALLDEDGKVLEECRFATPREYDAFLSEVAKAFTGFQADDLLAAVAGVPATVLDRERGVGVSFGNLPWRNVWIEKDLEQIFGCPVVVENDAKLAGLSEALLLKKQYTKVLYVTISTGIGYALIIDGQIDTSIGDGGGRTMLVEHKGKMMVWESFASGKAIYEKYGKPAHDIQDDRIWHTIARHIAKGLIELIAVTEPEVIVFGGSVGTYFDRYKPYLMTALQHYELPLFAIPPLAGAQHPEEAVIYGCYQLAKQRSRVHGSVH